MFRVLSLLVFCSLLNAASLEYYVSPQGNDAAAGTIDEPFATINGARRVLRNKILQETTGEIVVFFRGRQI